MNDKKRQGLKFPAAKSHQITYKFAKTPQLKITHKTKLKTLSNPQQKKSSQQSKSIKRKIKSFLSEEPITANFHKINKIHKNIYITNKSSHNQNNLPPKPRKISQITKKQMSTLGTSFGPASRVSQIQIKNSQFEQILFNQIKIGQLISKSQQCSVHRAYWQKKGKFIAVKSFNLNNHILSEIINHVNHYKSFNHPNILKYLGICKDQQKILILMEYMQGGSLYNLIQQYGVLEETLIKKFIKQIIEGLSYLNKFKISHNNLKTSNILTDGSGNIKLSDFITMKQLCNQSSSLNNNKDFSYWMPPQYLMQNKKHNKKTDVWSLGCVIIQMRTGKHIWKQNNINQIKQLMREQKLPYLGQNLSQQLIQFVSSCLMYDISKRPSIEDLKNSKFLKY